MRILSLACISFLITFSVAAQNGKIVEQTLYTIADSNKVRLKKLVPELDSLLSQVDFYKLTYLSDGLKVKGFMAMPKRKGTFPCVIYNRGGNLDFGAIGDGQLLRYLGVVASWGYIVVGSQYRGNMGGEGKEEFGGRDVNDVVNLIPVLAAMPGADTSRIGMYGWSRGGMMTYRALTLTNKIKAAVVGSGMANAYTNIRKRPEMDTFVFSQLLPDYAHNRDRGLKERSAVYWADQINKATPLLILQGSADWRVSPDEALEMVQKLYEVKHPLRFILFEGGQHSLVEHRAEVDRQVKDFLDRYVRDRRKWPDMEPHGD
ncbi:MAG TPA: prolyl oligopeptidase family serine peptidase [Flavisolibacter sp.]|jgi:dipeptidyl aminopeptidase/acylaminoacyl peptidase|nr:prolyl oligopeptidase family serine peptidase [Flavisolibacter sp.]